MHLYLNEFIDRFIYYWGCWEPNESYLLQRLLRPGDSFVDVGANVGYFSLLAARLVGHEGRVFAFEACPPIFDRLKANVQINKCDNVAIHNTACCDTAGVVTIRAVSTANPGASTLRALETTVGSWNVDAIALDDVLPPHMHYRVVKIDVEGAEHRVLQGMKRILDERRVDAVMCEVTDGFLRQMGSSACQLIALLQEAGLTSYIVRHRSLELVRGMSIGEGQANMLFVSPRADVAL
jgi:FkbM family methyltransferase